MNQFPLLTLWISASVLVVRLQVPTMKHLRSGNHPAHTAVGAAGVEEAEVVEVVEEAEEAEVVADGAAVEVGVALLVV